MVPRGSIATAVLLGLVQSAAGQGCEMYMAAAGQQEGDPIGACAAKQCKADNVTANTCLMGADMGAFTVGILACNSSYNECVKDCSDPVKCNCMVTVPASPSYGGVSCEQDKYLCQSNTMLSVYAGVPQCAGLVTCMVSELKASIFGGSCATVPEHATCTDEQKAKVCPTGDQIDALPAAKGAGGPSPATPPATPPTTPGTPTTTGAATGATPAGNGSTPAATGGGAPPQGGGNGTSGTPTTAGATTGGAPASNATTGSGGASPATSGGTPSTTGGATSGGATPPTPGGGGVVKDCGYGSFDSSTQCCVCEKGYKHSDSAFCSVCAEGFTMTQGGVCTNGLDGSLCHNALPAPYGCGGGFCTRSSFAWQASASIGRFPCAACAKPELDEKSGCAWRKRAPDGDIASPIPLGQPGSNWKNCLPKGPRMFAPFPYDPALNKDFNLIVVGCDLKTTDEYLVIPAMKETDEVDPETQRKKGKEITCQGITDEMIPSQCRFEKGQPITIPPGSANSGTNQRRRSRLLQTQQDCINGFMAYGSLPELPTTFTSSLEDTRKAGQGMGELMIGPIKYLTEEALGSDRFKWRRRLCRKVLRKTSSGEEKPVWVEVDAHNKGTTEREKHFWISEKTQTRSEDPAIRGAATGEEGDVSSTCCDGLKVGDGCIPLFVFLILWALLALLIALMACALHKTMAEIDAERNNLKFSDFGADKELMDIAAGQAEDDDL
eukprot:TRINITY_DN60643_c0_g1_i1.p1 TRINITY_DN60643_c0_g1~~TRINITY_DN60643_c0_g1_i1.p1  ORF type:complete len:722 (+),score=193.78 TRINITY_DN60643_c0_g1_i1:138-2303(+)